ncbi:MAG: hypothetical protein GXY20_08750 [Clostridiales bacterium]|nr:hypothetical protein [Clostridiales bacterium]
MKKVLALTLVAMLLPALFAGCGDSSKPTPTQEPPAATQTPATSAPTATGSSETSPPSAAAEPDSPYKFAAGKYEKDERGAANDFYEYELPLSTTDEVFTFLTYSFNLSAYPEEGYEIMALPTADREMTGVNVEYIITPVMTSVESFRVLVASDDLPDMCSNAIMNYNGTAEEMVEDGYFVNLYDYLDYMPNFSYMVCNYDPSDTVLYQTVFYHDDFIPAFYCITQEPVRLAGYCVREDWMQQFGMTASDLVTWDDLHEALLLAKTQITSCEYPFILRQNIDLTTGAWFMSHDTLPFIIDGSAGRNFVIDGKVKISNSNDSDRDFMRIISGFYSENLINPNWLAFSRAADTNAEINNGETFYAPMHTGDITNYEASSTQPGTLWRPTSPPLRYEGQILHLGGQLPRETSSTMSISAKCANIPLVVSWIDWRFSPVGGDLWYWGVEGEIFEFDDKGERVLTDFAINNPAGLTLNYLLLIYALNHSANVGLIQADREFKYPGGDITFGYALDWTNWLKENHDGAYLYPVGARLTVEQSAEINSYLSDVSTYMNENYAQFVDGSKNIETDWDNYINGLNSIGLPEIKAVYQEAYDAFMAG